MRKALWLLVLVMAFATSAMAQNTPLLEAFGGYQYLRVGKGASINMQGWDGSLAVNLNDWFGIVGDVSGSYQTRGGVPNTLSMHTFTFGPQITYRKEKRTAPFAHLLFGAARNNQALSVFSLGPARANTVFALMVGGGMDVKVNDRFSIRAGQFDWVSTKFRNSRQSNFRFSIGVVVGFGKK